MVIDSHTHYEDVFAVNCEFERRTTDVASLNERNLDLPPSVGSSLCASSVLEVLNASRVTTVVERQNQAVKESGENDEEAKDMSKGRTEAGVVVAGAAPFGYTIFVEELKRSAWF